MSEFDESRAAAEALAAVPIFAALTPVDLAKLAGALEDRWLDAGTVVFEAGGEGDALYILREGTAERRVAGSSLGFIKPLEVFGQLALLTDEPRSASIVASTPIRLWALPRSRFTPLLRNEPELMLRLAAAIGLELAQTRRALGALQREVDKWVGERFAALTADERELVEAAALFERPAPRVLARYLGTTPEEVALRVGSLCGATPLVRAQDGQCAIDPTIRPALVRHLDIGNRRDAIAARLCSAAKALEAEGHKEDAALAYLAAGARREANRVRGIATAADAEAGRTELPVVDATGEIAHAARPRKRAFKNVKVFGTAIALIPLFFWWAAPPEGLSVEGWRVLLSLGSAAILLGFEALPDAVVALALLGIWVVAGIVPPRVALDGFATQTWILVLAVLAVGVAVGNTGLLYRFALVALGRKPASFANRCVTLALVGTAVTPTLPNATSRVALAAPMVREVSEALGYEAGSRAATGLGLATLVGFGQMSALFLTGSSVGLLVHGLLPPAMQSEFSFGGWFIAALPLHAVLFALGVSAVILLYRPAAALSESGDRLAFQRAVLGPMRRDEKLCLAVLIGLIVGFLTEPLHGINAAWLGAAALLILSAGKALDTTMLRTGVNWPFLVFFGVLTSLGTVFATLKIDAWLGAALAEPIRAVAGSSVIFCLALALIGFALAFIVRWQAAAPLLTLVALPAAEAAHVHPFLGALIAMVSTSVWFLPYQSTVYLALYHGSGELFTHRDARKLAFLWGPLILVSIAAAVPVWQLMGLVR